MIYPPFQILKSINGEYLIIKSASENPVLWAGMKDASAKGRE
jgi:hypothetical protein